jgi:hypothetical protein
MNKTLLQVATLPAGVIKSPQLKLMTGYKKDGAMKRYLEEKLGIPCFDGKDGIWTTMELIKIAGMVRLGLVEEPKGEGRETWL